MEATLTETPERTFCWIGRGIVFRLSPTEPREYATPGDAKRAAAQLGYTVTDDTLYL